MGKRKPNKTIKDSKILERNKSDLRNHVETRRNQMAAGKDVIVSRSLQLPNSGPGSRFLLMKRRVQEGEDETMRKCNPILVGRLLRGTASIIDMKIIRDGGLLIKAEDYKSANAIFQIVKLSVWNVVVTEYTQLNKSVGVVFDRSLTSATDEEIKEELKREKCIAIKRVKKKLPDGTTIDTGTFFITFGTVKLPGRVTIGYSSVPVTPYVPNPIRCFKCQLYGHVASSCKREKLCVNCGQPEHVQQGEKCANPSKCINCGSKEHNSMARECPEFCYRKKIEEIKVYEEKNHFEAQALLDARDPQARPSKNRGPTYAQIAQKARCSCICKCGEKKAGPMEKRKRIMNEPMQTDSPANKKKTWRDLEMVSSSEEEINNNNN